MVTGKGTSKPYISFIGNSAIDVTGSMHLVRFKKYMLLLDCGLIQLNDPQTNYKANLAQLKKIKIPEIDYIILTHCHIDHSGLIPALYARGCHAHVYVPKNSKKFLRLLWEDSMKIMISDCQKINRHGLKATPFYDMADIENALGRCIEIDFNSEYQINSDMSFQYYSAGHIIHSAQVVLTLYEGNIIKRIGYTGDIGGNNKRPFIVPKQNLPFVELLIGENTYNQPTRPGKAKDRIKDIEKIFTVESQALKILIPTFSLGRTQEILTTLYDLGLDFHVPIYLDSPLAQKICDIWDDNSFHNDVMQMQNLHIIQSWEESQVLQKKIEHCIILSASGFLNGGRAVSHLKTILPDNRNHILFCGFSGENNLASQIKNGDSFVKVDGEMISNNANITCLYSFSSHAGYEELLDYYNELRYNKIALVHGDIRYKNNFCNVLQDQLHNDGKSAKVVCVNEGTKIYI